VVRYAESEITLAHPSNTVKQEYQQQPRLNVSALLQRFATLGVFGLLYSFLVCLSEIGQTEETLEWPTVYWDIFVFLCSTVWIVDSTSFRLNTTTYLLLGRLSLKWPIMCQADIILL